MQKPSSFSKSPAVAHGNSHIVSGILTVLLFVATLTLSGCQTMDPSSPTGFIDSKPSKPSKPSPAPATAQAQPVYRFLELPPDDSNTTSTNEVTPE